MIENIRFHAATGDRADQTARLPQLCGGDFKIAGFDVANRFRKQFERFPEQCRMAGIDGDTIRQRLREAYV